MTLLRVILPGRVRTAKSTARQSRINRAALLVVKRTLPKQDGFAVSKQDGFAVSKQDPSKDP